MMNTDIEEAVIAAYKSPKIGAMVCRHCGNAAVSGRIERVQPEYSRGIVEVWSDDYDRFVKHPAEYVRCTLTVDVIWECECECAAIYRQRFKDLSPEEFVDLFSGKTIKLGCIITTSQSPESMIR